MGRTPRIKTPRAETPSDRQYTFEDVARFVCNGADPPTNLAMHFRFWAWPLEGYPEIERTPPLGRADMVEALWSLISATDVILAGLASQAMAFVMKEQEPPFDRVALLYLLLDLKRRCAGSIVSSALVGKASGAKRGPGNTASPDGGNLRLLCAGAILLAWEVIHGKLPGSRHPMAMEAAEAFFRLAGAPVGKPELQQRGLSRGKNPLNAWRRYFEIARAQEPILGPSHQIYVQLLRRSLLTSELAGNDHRSGGQPFAEVGPNLSPKD